MVLILWYINIIDNIISYRFLNIYIYILTVITNGNGSWFHRKLQSKIILLNIIILFILYRTELTRLYAYYYLQMIYGDGHYGAKKSRYPIFFIFIFSVFK